VLWPWSSGYLQVAVQARFGNYVKLGMHACE
jgi:hypothetical protein